MTPMWHPISRVFSFTYVEVWTTRDWTRSFRSNTRLSCTGALMKSCLRFFSKKPVFDGQIPLRPSRTVMKGYHMDVSENSGTPKSSILIGFSIINHPFWGTPIIGNTHILFQAGRPLNFLGGFVGSLFDLIAMSKDCHDLRSFRGI